MGVHPGISLITAHCVEETMFIHHKRLRCSRCTHSLCLHRCYGIHQRLYGDDVLQTLTLDKSKYGFDATELDFRQANKRTK